MKTEYRGLTALAVVIGITILAVYFLDRREPALAGQQSPAVHGGGVVQLETRLVQDKVLKGSEGSVSVALTLTGAEQVPTETAAPQPVDLVVVLDRSGSMEGQKLYDAKDAVLRLLPKMNAGDRMGLLTYSNGVELRSGLTPMDAQGRRHLASQVRLIHSGGGTNLGGGLDRGIALLKGEQTSDRQKRVILISDGLANQGMTDPVQLGYLAAGATESGQVISTVGVGYDFNELLMTTIADHGGGSYYFLEDPASFAAVFEKEFETTRNVVASNLELHIPLPEGVRLTGAGGYPINFAHGEALIRIGDLLAGQTRQLFLTFTIPSSQEQEFVLSGLQLSYSHQGQSLQVADTSRLTIRCVDDEAEVLASIDDTTWSKQVVQEEYSRLKESVAHAIRKGKKDEAMQSIAEYEARNRVLNEAVGSSVVQENLDTDVSELKRSVEDTFAGAPSAVEAKKKQQSKMLQYESYQKRRDKQ